MPRLPVLLLVAVAVLISGSATGAQAPVAPTVIFGGDLPHPVRLAAVDAEALARRINLPPDLDEAPDVTGDAYQIRSPYWDAAVRSPNSDKPRAEDEATYFPEGGFLKARQAGEDVWLVLDLRQRALLDRYIRLTRAGLLSERPGSLEVLRVASRSEEISIEVAGSPLSATESRDFWTILGASPLPLFPEPPQPPTASPNGAGAWVVFNLEDGRATQVFYNSQSRRLIDRYGTETYFVIEPLAEMLDSIIRNLGPSLAVRQEEGRGSPLWWPVMIGGGMALIAAAMWLRRGSLAKMQP